MHADAIETAKNVLVVDDLLATGGTLEAIVKLVESLGGKVVAAVFLIELKGLNGREKLKNIERVESVIAYDGK